MTKLAGPERESIHSATGTAAHEIGEQALRSGKDCVAWLGETVKTKEHEIEIDEEVCESAQVYVDYCRKRMSPDATVLIEQNYRLDALKPPFDAGGTCDFIAIWLSAGLLEVVDFKNGRTVVQANGNKQARTYALCALLNLPQEIAGKIKRIKVTIVQPRASHSDGVIRSEEFHISDLVLWTSDLVKKMGESKQALVEFDALPEGNRVAYDEWCAKWLRTGACDFCPAEGFCPAVRAEALSFAPIDARDWFEDTTLATPPSNMPMPNTPEEIAHTLDGLEALESWINAVRGFAFNQADGGMAIPGYQLAAKIGRRKWKADDKTIAAALQKDVGLTDDQLWTKKIVSPAQVEKLKGVKGKRAIAAMWESPVTGKNLVSTAKTTRPAVASTSEKFFEAPQ